MTYETVWVFEKAHNYSCQKYWFQDAYIQVEIPSLKKRKLYIPQIIMFGWYSCEGRFRSPYARWFLSLGYWVDQSGEENIPLGDRDHLRSDPHEFPGFLN